MSPPAIILCTLNAKYIHASLGLRYLLANMARHGGAELRAATVLREFTIARPTSAIVEALLGELGEAADGRPQMNNREQATVFQFFARSFWKPCPVRGSPWLVFAG